MEPPEASGEEDEGPSWWWQPPRMTWALPWPFSRALGGPGPGGKLTLQRQSQLATDIRTNQPPIEMSSKKGWERGKYKKQKEEYSLFCIVSKMHIFPFGHLRAPCTWIPNTLKQLPSSITLTCCHCLRVQTRSQVLLLPSLPRDYPCWRSTCRV